MMDRLQALLSPSNPVFARARAGGRIPNALVTVAVCVLLLLGAFLPPMVAIMAVTGDKDRLDRFMEGTYFFFVPFTLLAVLTLSWVKFCEKRSPATVGLPRAGAFIGYLSGFGLGLASAGAVVGTLAMTGGVTVQPAAAQPFGQTALGMVLVMLAAYIVQGGTEELLIRGWFMQALGARYQPWIGVLASSILFLLLHVPSNPIFAVNLLLCGLFLALYCLRAGNLWGICGWHGAWNWTLANVFGLAVSGHEQPGVLFDLQATGPALLTGGGYGPEASLLTTTVLLAGIAVVVATSQRGGGTEAPGALRNDPRAEACRD